MNLDIVQQVQNWEISPIKAYRDLRTLKDFLENCLKQIDEEVRREVALNPSEYKDFSLSTRKTYQYSENEEYNIKKKEYDIKNEELKELEKQIKLATEASEKWNTYIDKDGVVIEPVNVKYSERLTYTPKK